MLERIWGSESCLNNLYERKLFYSAWDSPLETQNLTYATVSSQSSNLDSTFNKVKLFFLKVGLFLLSAIPYYNKKINNSFTVVNTLKNKPKPIQRAMERPTQSNSTPVCSAGETSKSAIGLPDLKIAHPPVLSTTHALPHSQEPKLNRYVPSTLSTSRVAADLAPTFPTSHRSSLPTSDVQQIDINALLLKYGLILCTPDESGISIGYLKDSTGQWSKCLVDTKPKEMLTNYIVYYWLGSDLKWGHHPASETTILTNDTFQKMLTELKHRKINPCDENELKKTQKDLQEIAKRHHAEEAKTKAEINANAPEALSQLTKIHERFLQNNPVKKSWTDTMEEVNEYILNKLKLLKEGKEVNLPYFFHATGSRDKAGHVPAHLSIINSGFIRTSDGICGKGVYMSTYDESDAYGPYTFAFSKKIHKYSAGYFQSLQGQKLSRKFVALWIRFDNAIPVSDKADKVLAHIVAPPEKCAELREQLDAKKLNVPVLSRDANRYITTLFEDIGNTYHLPDEWNWLGGHRDLNDFLPDNVFAKKKTPNVGIPDD